MLALILDCVKNYDQQKERILELLRKVTCVLEEIETSKIKGIIIHLDESDPTNLIINGDENKIVELLTELFGKEKAVVELEKLKKVEMEYREGILTYSNTIDKILDELKRKYGFEILTF